VSEPEKILRAFGISGVVKISRLGSGHIHQTYKVEGKSNFVLQRINKNVFSNPEIIASNNRIAFQYLKHHYPDYLFPQALPDRNGNDLFYDNGGFPWRLYPLIENTYTIDEVGSEQEAFEAAKGFGQLTRNLNGVDISLFKPTLEHFHDLAWRYKQFEDALQKAKPDTQLFAKNEIELAQSFQYLIKEFNQLIDKGDLILRIMHNDTKVNNILYNTVTRKAVCAIDLDTLMPGYFIYDLGDMVRTFVSPVNEEEKDISKISFRKNIYDALLNGYLSQMDGLLSVSEKKSITFSGMMMTYIMALRMLADYLRGNTYYSITYPDQNLVRSRNQLCLLQLISQAI